MSKNTEEVDAGRKSKQNVEKPANVDKCRKMSKKMKQYWAGHVVSKTHSKNISNAAKTGWQKRYKTRQKLRANLKLTDLEMIKDKPGCSAYTPPYGYKKCNDKLIAYRDEFYILYRILYLFKRGYSSQQIKNIFDGVGILCRGHKWSRKTINSLAKRHLDGKIYK